MAHGFTETELWLALYNYHYYGYEYDNSSSFSKYIVNDAEKYLSSLDHNFADSDQFIKRLIGNKPALVDKFIDKLIQGSYAGENYIAELTPVKKDYLTINAAKHEDYLVSLLYFKYKDKNVDYKMTPYYLTDLLETNYPNKYNKEIEIYLKKRADEALNYQTQMYPSIFDRTLETLLRYNSAENAFSTTSNYLRKFKDIRPDSIKIWLKKLKKYNISLK
jgi:hypothetical protein